MPPSGAYAKYKQHIRNYLYAKCGWDKLEAIKWLNENEAFVRQMMATEAHYRETATAIDEMERKINNAES